MKTLGQLLIVWMVVGMLVAGCMPYSCMPYKGEKFVEVQNNETAFVIPLEGNLKKQQKLKWMSCGLKKMKS